MSSNDLNPPMKAPFIVLEGLDGAGTTTQTDLLYKAVLKHGASVFKTQEPTTSSIGELIRKILAGSEKVCPQSMALLFAADRYEHIHDPEIGIQKRLDAGDWVISDRYLFSSLAYQGPLIGYDLVAEMNSGIPLPDWTFFLTIDAKVAMKRLENRKNLDVFENIEFQTRVEAAYREAFDRYTDKAKILYIDADADSGEIHREICKNLQILPIQ